MGLQSNDIKKVSIINRRSFLKECLSQKTMFFMVLPGLILTFLFSYLPIYGVLIAFKDYNIGKGIFRSNWAGFKWFEHLFTDPMFFRILKNTLILGSYGAIIAVLPPLMLALLLNEVRSITIKKIVQSATYLPYLLSTMVIVGMFQEFASMDGLFNQFLGIFGVEPQPLIAIPEWFRSLFNISVLWQYTGWSAIFYIAALSGVDPTLYDVAKIDGANRWKQLLHISIPTIKPTIIILVLMALPGIIGGGDAGRILLMYTPTTYEVADVFGTYVVREGVFGGRFEYATAVGLFQSVVAFLFLYISNKVSSKVSETSIF